MSQCEKCGTDNMDYNKYCRNCGYELPKVAESSHSTPTPPPPPKKNKASIKIALGVAVGIIVAFVIDQFFLGAGDFFSIDKSMVKYANEFNKSCPMMLDSETRLDNVTALPDKHFQYTYTLVNLTKETIDTLQLKSVLTPSIINSIKTSPQMKFIRDNEMTLNYYYKDKDGNYLFHIPISPQQYQ